MVNKRNLKSGLADGLTEIGLSQVKSEIGSTQEHLKLYVDTEFYMLDPVTFERYRSGAPGLTEEYQIIADDYKFNLEDTSGEFYRFTSDNLVDIYGVDSAKRAFYQGTTSGFILLNQGQFSITNAILTQGGTAVSNGHAVYVEE